MPDTVVTAMMAELRERHLLEDERRREILLSTFAESRPQLESRLNELTDQKEQLLPKEFLLKLVNVAEDFWTIGSKRSAIMTVVFEFERSNQHLEVVERVEIGTRLLEMCLEEGLPDMAKGWAAILRENVRTLDSDHPSAFPCLRMIAEWFISLCAYDEAKQTLSEAIAIAPDGEQVALLQAKSGEIDFLQGELHSAREGTRND